jgi:hypothetical protein
MDYEIYSGYYFREFAFLVKYVMIVMESSVNNQSTMHFCVSDNFYLLFISRVLGMKDSNLTKNHKRTSDLLLEFCNSER